MTRGPNWGLSFPWPLLLLIALSSPSALAKGSPTARARSQGSTSSSSLAQLAAKVAGVPIGAPSLLVIAPLVSSQTSSDLQLSEEASARLHQSILQIVGSTIGAARLREKSPLSLGEARTRARRKNLSLVYLQPTIDRKHLQIELLYINWSKAFWRRALNPEGSVAETRTFRVPVDLTLRRHFPRPKGLFSERKIFKNPIASPLALACGDIDGDGGSELLIVGRHRIALGRFSKTSFEPMVIATTSKLSPISGAPLRAPLGAAKITARGAFIGMSDRRDSFLVDENLTVLQRFSSRYPLSDRDCVAFNERGLSSRITNCTGSTLNTSNPISLDALAIATITEADGTTTKLSAHTENGTGVAKLRIRRAATETSLTLDSTGDVLAWADLDDDGSIELLSSRSTLDNTHDSIEIHRLENGRLTKLAISKGGPIVALAVCPRDGKAHRTVVAAAGADLWVFP